MPPAPTFDYYETLEVTKSADTEQITASYRSLARIHHPDKDRENPEATAKFQKIQEAHENLSDPAKRARYDARIEGRRPPGPHPFHYHYESDEYDEFSDDGFPHAEFEDLFSNFFFHSRGGGFAFRPGAGFGFGFGAPTDHFGGMTEEEYRRMRRAEQEEEEQRVAAAAAEQRRRFAAEKLARDNEAREKREALEKARKAFEEEKRAAKLKLEKMAMEKAEKRWETLGAKTTAEKQSTCLHPDFWPKEQQKRKFKCGSCHQKRGPTGYKCPFCSLLSCQVCLSQLTKQLAAS